MSVFYGDRMAGGPTIAATGSLTGTSQQEIITASKLCFVILRTDTACVASPKTVGNGGTFTGYVRLLDYNDNPVAATTNITVSVSTDGDLGAPSPTSLQINIGETTSLTPVSAKLKTGNASGTLTGQSANLVSATVRITR